MPVSTDIAYVAVSLIPWFGALAGAMFLALCVHMNKKSGFQRRRQDLSILEEGMAWIDTLEAGLAVEAGPAPNIAVSPLQSTPASIEYPSMGVQLRNLGAALEEGRSPLQVNVSAYETTKPGVPSEVERETDTSKANRV